MNTLTNARQYSLIQPQNLELEWLPHKNYLFDLDYLTLLSVHGEKARDFLQGQLSCHLGEINEETIRQGVLCNLKGRILAILDVIEESETLFSLLLPQDIMEETQASLSKAAFFSRVKLSHNPLKILGFFAQSDHDPLPFGMTLPQNNYNLVRHKKGLCYQIAPQFYIVITSPEYVDECIKPFKACQQYRGSYAWHVLQLQHQRVDIYPESRGLFLPHRLNMHRTGYLNFEKGCYKGQEIIARMHYRATHKHTLRTYLVKTTAELSSGIELYDERGEIVVAELIDYASIDEGKLMIVVSVLANYQGNFMTKTQEEIAVLL